MMSKFWVTELKENVTKPFYCVTKPFFQVCDRRCPFHTKPWFQTNQAGPTKSLWKGQLFILWKFHMWPITSLSFHFRFPMSVKFKIQFFFPLFTLFKMLFHLYSFSFHSLHYSSFSEFFSFFLSFLISNYILLYFAEKLKDHEEDEVLNK
jgi:hypothetical protein